MRQFLVPAAFLLYSVSAAAPLVAVETTPPAYLDPARPLEERVDDLVGRLTLNEKVSQMVDNAAAIPRLNIPAYPWWSEALHGIGFAGEATVFPQAIGLAATFDTTLMQRVASVIGDEGRAKFHEAERRGAVRRFYGLTMFSPNINIFRDPRWGRGQETYGEDPYLTARMGVAFVRGLQGDDPRYLKLGTTAKHYAVHSGPEPSRHRFDAKGSLRDMRDTYLPAFEALVREGQTVSVMCAYNRVNGDPACANEILLDELLRRKWGFKGYVVSDCGAIHDIHRNHKVEPDEAHAAAQAVLAGTDLECDDQAAYQMLPAAVEQQLIDEAAITEAVKRLYRIRFRLGLFDPPERVPYTQIPFASVASPEHGQVALDAARASIVLLKNQGGALPLPKSLKKVLVVGPNATDTEALRGNYAGSLKSPVTILAGIQAKLGAQRVLYAPGVGHVGPATETIPASALRLKGEYFGNLQLEGAPVATRADATIDFDSLVGRVPAGVPDEGFSVRWTGTLTVPKAGRYLLGVLGDDGFRLIVDGQRLVEDWTDHGPTLGTGAIELTAGKPYALTVEYYQNRGGSSVRLVWQTPGLGERRLDEAAKAARKADAVIAVMGLSPLLEGEEMGSRGEGFLGGDRTTIGLPRVQEELLQKLATTGKPVILVLLNGSPLAVNWAGEHIPAILEAWYPGQEGGTAVADVLFGDVNPAGRLPLTFYRGVDDLPPFTDYSMDGRTYRYYRGEPLFPYGHGLSYTRFAYGPATLEQPTVGVSEEAQVAVEVTNVGAVEGDEVVQLYVTALDPGAVRAPIRALAGLQRVRLKPGERRRMSFTLRPEQRRLWDYAGDPVPMTGRVRLTVGGKQPGFKGLSDATTTGVSETTLTIR